MYEKFQTNKFLIKTILFNLITFKFIYTKSYYYFNIYLNNNYFIQAIKNTFIYKCIMISYMTCLRFEKVLISFFVNKKKTIFYNNMRVFILSL